MNSGAHKSSPERGGGPCEAWWRGRHGLWKLPVARPRFPEEPRSEWQPSTCVNFTGFGRRISRAPPRRGEVDYGEGGICVVVGALMIPCCAGGVGVIRRPGGLEQPAGLHRRWAGERSREPQRLDLPSTRTRKRR